MIESPLPPEAVLAAIRDDAREWRASAIPAALRDRGRGRVEVRTKGRRFRLELPSLEEPEDRVTLRGWVLPAPGGGSTEHATFRVGPEHGWMLIAGAGGIALFWSLKWGFILFGAAAAFDALDRWRTAWLDPDTSPLAAYLSQRLQAAVERAASPPAPDP